MPSMVSMLDDCRGVRHSGPAVKLTIEWIFEQDRLLAARADRDENDFAADHCFDAPDVILRGLWQVRELTDVIQGSLPAIHLLIHRLGFLHDFRACGKLVNQRSF